MAAQRASGQAGGIEQIGAAAVAAGTVIQVSPDQRGVAIEPDGLAEPVIRRALLKLPKGD